jgi:hypothetical protein
VRWRRWHIGAGRWQRHRFDRHRLRLFVDPVGDEQAGHRELLPAQHGEVYLPEILEAGRGVNRFHDLGQPTLAGPVVHDRDPRPQGMDQHFGVRRVLPVMQAEKDIHRPDPVARAHQLEFLVLREIAEVNRPEPAKGDETAN